MNMRHPIPMLNLAIRRRGLLSAFWLATLSLFGVSIVGCGDSRPKVELPKNPTPLPTASQRLGEVPPAAANLPPSK
jgi:hypothetical protein